MYSNDSIQIRQGFVNYIGALIASSPFEGKAACQQTVAVLIEEALKLSQNEDKVCDLYILKPLFRGLSIVLKQNIDQMGKLPPAISAEAINKYKSILQELDNIIKKVEE